MIYLDNAATSFPKPEGVYQALDRFARTALANPGRAGHRMAVGAKRALDDDRWYRTGDVGVIRDGYVYLEGRRNDLIIRGGENISPVEIENRLF